MDRLFQGSVLGADLFVEKTILDCISGVVKNDRCHDLQRAIREAGFHPVERDTLYRPIERTGNAWSVAKTV